jgi:predicted transposase/invertase (TIGR01784 family)
MSTLISFDYAIKYLLKNKGDYDIVEGFISALLQAEGYGPVKIKALLESESNKEAQFAKRSIADLIVEDEHGVCYIVEIERESTESFMHKACFNTSRLIIDSLSASEDYTTIKKVFHISLLYFKWNNSTKALHHGKTIFKEVDTQHPIDLRLTNTQGAIIDLARLLPEYFLISIPLFDDTIRTEMDEWLYVMKNSEVKENFKSPYMKKVTERLNILKMNDKEQAAYYAYMKDTLTQRDAVQAAENRGKIEGKIEVAQNLLAQGFSLEEVSKFTGLSREELGKF